MRIEYILAKIGYKSIVKTLDGDIGISTFLERVIEFHVELPIH